MIPVRISSKHYSTKPNHNKKSSSRPQSSLVKLRHADRHCAPIRRPLSLGLHNLRSLNNKVDEIIELRKENAIDVLFLVETWHDADSVCLSRLRSAGLEVLDRPRPRQKKESLNTNHGGIAAVSVPGVSLVQQSCKTKPTTFEHLCMRITSGGYSCTALLVYRTGPIPLLFFHELSSVLEAFSTRNEPVYLVGDLNIHLERPDDRCTKLFTDVLSAHCLISCCNRPTHDKGGALNVIATRACDRPSSIDVTFTGLSDHRLLTWPAPLCKPIPVYTVTTTRPWRKLNTSAFQSALVASDLCSPTKWKFLDVDCLALMFENTITSILDELIPFKKSKCRRRPSDPWFDSECRQAKRALRKAERRLRRRRLQTSSIEAAETEVTALRHSYRHLLRNKREHFWREKIQAEHHRPKQLWRSIDNLMGRSRERSSNHNITATDFLRHFEDKVLGIRNSTHRATPIFINSAADCSFSKFRKLTLRQIITAINHLPNKQSPMDPCPTWLFKANVDILAPFLVHLFNLSLHIGIFPQRWKQASVTPVMKKGKRNSSDPSSFRPISNLATLSKLLERLVAAQLNDYLRHHSLLPELQSAYRAYHSTETAMLKVTSDILTENDNGKIVLLALLDLSSAFDTVDHGFLLRRLHLSYGFHGRVLNWLTSFISDRCQLIRCATSVTRPSPVSCGVPQGSVLGPLLFILYTADLAQVIQSKGLTYHAYADDLQIYGSCSPSNPSHVKETMTTCILDIQDWLLNNRLQLNVEKTEIMWCASNRRQHQLPLDPLHFGEIDVTPVRSARSLGVILDSSLSMKPFVNATVGTCFGTLRQIRSIRRSVSREVIRTLVISLIHSRVDYCCALLAGSPSYLTRQLQTVLNCSARVIYNSHLSDSASILLKELKWLPMLQRIQFRLASHVFRCLSSSAPTYLSRCFRRVSDISSRANLRSASKNALQVSRTRHSTIGDRAFQVAAAMVWNRLPSDVTDQTTVSAFKSALKIELLKEI